MYIHNKIYLYKGRKCRFVKKIKGEHQYKFDIIGGAWLIIDFGKEHLIKSE